jgi:hypothetical protein
MEIPQNTDDLTLWYAVHSLLVNYWRDVDLNHGRDAHDFYVADGSFIVGDNHFESHEGIRTFYTWRRGREKSGSRHVLSNLIVVADGEGRARGFGIMTLHRASGLPPFRTTVPTLVADLTCDCRLCDDGRWRFETHLLEPIFIGDDVPLSLSVNTKHLARIKHTITDDNPAVDRTTPPRVG